MHATSEEKSDDSKDNFYDDLEQVFGHFPKHSMKILLVDINTKVGKDYVFNPTIWNESLHQDSNDKDVRIVNNASSNIMVLRAVLSLIENFKSTTGPLLIGRSKQDLPQIGRYEMALDCNRSAKFQGS